MGAPEPGGVMVSEGDPQMAHASARHHSVVVRGSDRWGKEESSKRGDAGRNERRN